jgi:hypothetical protein
MEDKRAIIAFPGSGLNRQRFHGAGSMADFNRR